ncbi:metalloregulator ArsR/SmtB family transcription factor [bacterium]|nr:metalloregulator ArsR/SmtB family transcription factor [bacterium]
MGEVLKAVADENRLRIVNLLLQRDELCVCDIERVLGMTQTKVSRHLGTLRHAQLVSTRRDGRWMYYTLRRESPFVLHLLEVLKEGFADNAQYHDDINTLENATELVCCIPGEEA